MIDFHWLDKWSYKFEKKILTEYTLYLLILQAFLTIPSQAGQGKEKRKMLRNFHSKYIRQYYLLMLLDLCHWGFRLLSISLSSKSIPWSLESPLLAIIFLPKFNCQAGVIFRSKTRVERSLPFTFTCYKYSIENASQMWQLP